MEKIAEYKKLNAPTEIKTLNTADMAKETGNLYETVVVIAKRSNQISQELKQELSEKLSAYTCSQDNLEEVFQDEEQINLSRRYEELPKPTMLAVKEYLDGRIIIEEPSASQQNDTPSEGAE